MIPTPEEFNKLREVLDNADVPTKERTIYVPDVATIDDISEVNVYNRKDTVYYHRGLGELIRIEFGSEIDNCRDVIGYEVIKL